MLLKKDGGDCGGGGGQQVVPGASRRVPWSSKMTHRCVLSGQNRLWSSELRKTRWEPHVSDADSSCTSAARSEFPRQPALWSPPAYANAEKRQKEAPASHTSGQYDTRINSKITPWSRAKCTFGSEEGFITGEAVWKTPWHPITASSKLPASIRSALTKESLSLAPSSLHRWDTFFWFPGH